MKLFDNIITKIEEAALAISILLMALILVVGVFCRTVLNASLTYTEEVGIALGVLITFFAIGYCAREARHISMSMIFDLVPDKAKKVMMIIITLGTALIMGWLCVLSVQYLQVTHELGRVTPALRIPYWITLIPLPLGFALATLEYTRTLILNITRKEVYLSSKYRLGENTDEALGLVIPDSGPENNGEVKE